MVPSLRHFLYTPGVTNIELSPTESSAYRDKLTRAATEAAQAGADIQTGYYETGLQARQKGDVDLVTQADVESQKAIIDIITKRFPTHKILAEEEGVGHELSFEEPTWIIDPLDGTTNFAHGLPLFAVSIALMEKREITFGLVQVPLLQETYIAHKGSGATLNGKPITVTTREKVSDSLLATGFPYDRRDSPNNNLNYFCQFELRAHCVRRMGAAAVDLAFLATGRLDGFWEPKLQPWDIAAGILLVQEAGGEISDFAGKPLNDLWCGEIVGSNRKIHREIIEILMNTRKAITLDRTGALTIT